MITYLQLHLYAYLYLFLNLIQNLSISVYVSIIYIFIYINLHGNIYIYTLFNLVFQWFTSSFSNENLLAVWPNHRRGRSLAMPQVTDPEPRSLRLSQHDNELRYQTWSKHDETQNIPMIFPWYPHSHWSLIVFSDQPCLWPSEVPWKRWSCPPP